MGRNNLTSIEITDTHIKLLQARLTRSGPVLTSLEARALEPDNDVAMQDQLKNMVVLRKISPETLTCIIPRRMAVLKQFKLPSQDNQEIEKMVKLQLGNTIPYDPADIILCPYIAERYDDGFSRVLALIVHKDVSQRYSRLFLACGLSPSNLYLSPFGLLGWLEYEEQFRKFSTRTVAILNIDAGHSEIIFCCHKSLLFSRHISFGSRDLSTDHEQGMLEQIEMSLSVFQKEGMGQDIEQMVIVGSSGKALGLKESLMANHKISIEVIHFMENVKADTRFELMKSENLDGISFASGLGVLLTQTARQVNLLPQEVTLYKNVKRRNKAWAHCIALLVAIFILGHGFLVLKLYKEKQLLKDIEREASDSKKRMEQAGRSIELIEKLNEEMLQLMPMTNIVSELLNLTPVEISYRSFNLDERNIFSIQGYALTSPSVNNFQAGLVKSPFFKNVNLEYSTNRKIFQQEVSDFKIVAELNLEK